MDKKLERLYEQLGRIDSVIEKQTSQRLEKMKEIQQKRETDKRAWLKEAGPVIDTFLLEAAGENYYYDLSPADLTKAVNPEKIRTFIQKEEKAEEGPAAGKEGGGKPSSPSGKSGAVEPAGQKLGEPAGQKTEEE